MIRTLNVSLLFTAFLLGMGTAVSAQAPEGVAVSGSIRARGYSWDWFGRSDGDYSYPATIARAAVSRTGPSREWVVEFALPIVAGLPSTAVAAAPQGQLGLGASYFAANSNTANDAALFLKQGYVRFSRLAGVAGQSIKIGRMEFNDGAETSLKDPTLAALKRDRLSQRLLGAFGFSDVGRSIDGVLYGLTKNASNVTAIAGRPTQGVFEVNGWPELNVNLFYLAFTRTVGVEHDPGEFRLFALGYDDYRHGVVKTDNRPAAIRAADVGHVAVATYGGHYIREIVTTAGAFDALAWGAVQTGSWGALAHRAGAYAVEGGWQPTGLDRVNPWFRGGFDYGSGDSNPSDTRHGTFFQVLPTPRIYARLPFYNLMNSRDAFGEVILRPRRDLTLRADAHALHLAQPADLWYSGGGAFQTQTFGYSGRPSSGQSSLATLFDISGDYAFRPRIGIAAYFGDAAGRAVTQTIYPAGRSLRFAYAELLVRF